MKYLANQALVVEVWGRQTGRKVSRAAAPTQPTHSASGGNKKTKPRSQTDPIKQPANSQTALPTSESSGVNGELEVRFKSVIWV